MTYADGRAIRAGTHDVSHHVGFYAAWTVVVLLARLGQLTRWALREGWYRPRLATAVAVSSLVGFWTTPLGFVITLATTMLGIATWEVINFGHSTRASAWAYGRSLKDLSRLVYRAWVVARRWRDLAAGFLKAEHGLTGDAPRLRQWRFHSRVRASCVVNVSNAKQHIVDDLAGKAPILAQTLKLHSAAVEPVRGRPGLARFTFYWGSRLEEVQPITELPEPQTGWAFFGLGEDEQAAGIRLDLSALFAGESRSGKSTAMWAAILSTLEQYEAGGDPVEFWVVDLALTEFADAVPLTEDDRPEFATDLFGGNRYATTQGAACVMLRMLTAEANRRAALMAGKARKLTPTEEMPRIVLIVDEMLRLIEKTGGKDAARNGTEAEGGLRQLLTQYAKFGITAWAGTQASKVDVLTSARDWFQQRVAFSTATPQMTDTTLGTGAAAAGATCHQFSPHRDAGRGFMKRDGYAGYFPFRGVWIADDHTQAIGRGEIPDELAVARGIPTAQAQREQDRPGAVYLFFDEAGNLLYVGKTREFIPSDRWLDHFGGSTEQPWSAEVHQVVVETAYPGTGQPYSERDAVQVERRYIREGHPTLGGGLPRHNKERYATVTPYELTGSRN